MKRAVGTCALFGILMLALGCQQPRCNWVFDRQADYSKLASYRWLAAEEHGTAGRDIGGTPLNALIRELVDRELAAKGYSLAPEGADASFTVQQKSVLEFRSGAAPESAGTREDPGLFGGERFETVYGASDLQPGVPSSYKIGTIYVTIRDAKSDAPLWRGVGEAVIREQSTDQARRERLDRAIKQIMSRFPPNVKR